jgi:5'-deoxynucleotidase
LLALYHDAGEVLTGDMPAPVKYSNPELRAAYRGIEAAAHDTLFAMVPDALKADYRPLLFPADADRPLWELVKAADKVCAYVKCLEEIAAGNGEFVKAEKALRETVDVLALPEVRYFLDTFAPSFRLTLDDLM